MNALAIHLYLTITFINLVIIRLAQNYRIIVEPLWNLFSSMIMWQHVFTVPGTFSSPNEWEAVDAPAYCPINQRFQLACLCKRVAPEIFFLLWAEKSPQLPAVGSIFPPKAEHLLTAPHALWVSSKRNRR